ncbi:ATP-binding protein [Falsiruegeria mediterranea]|uniref:ATP-binding protein n=1 Tax=Falsiruegeria mediterranea TaxID=1280832 RepID=UPI0015F26D8B|nr:ATP-binding protein [Falsiruegeria mediterranea]
MPLKDRVSVNGRFLRSVRIDQDDPGEALDGFVFSSSIREILTNFSHQQSEAGQGAFTWTGPYGSGKSSVALVLSALLSGEESERKAAAKQTDPEFAKSLWKLLPPKRDGWKCLSVVGRSAEAFQLIGDSIKDAKLTARQRKLDTPEKVIALLQGLASQDSEHSGGLILFLDEMGKVLEHTASSTGDAYFFQLLGEAASRSDGRLIVVGILHQSFQEYASRLARDIKDEWSKIQGRYIDIPVNVSGDEQIELVSRAIVSESQPQSAYLNAEAAVALLKNVRPGGVTVSEDLLKGAWPLNPLVTLVLGPASRRSYGQNQRSIFSFLGSSELFGFQDFLEKSDDDEPQEYGLADFWDYLEFNLQASIAVSLDSHHFANARDAISRWEAKNGGELGTHLLKSIALLELTQKQTGIGATFEALCLATNVTNVRVKEALAELKGASIIVFRKFRGTYSLFDGSDFDIELALDEALRETSEFDVGSVSDVLSTTNIVAKRHYRRTGALRWCALKVLPESQVEDYVLSFTPTNGCFGAFIIALNDTSSKGVTQPSGLGNQADFAIARSEKSKNLIALAREHAALKAILAKNSEIQRDKIARREVNDRIEAIGGRIEHEIWQLINSAEWKTGNQETTRQQWGSLTVLASAMADNRFSRSPGLRNELLNRTKPSASANSALKLLLHAAVLKEGQEGLGFKKFPAEKALFVSLIEANQMYAEVDGEWKFVPPSGDDAANLLPIWKATIAFLKRNGSRNVQLTDVYELWKKPPFGLKEGLMPFLAVLFMLAERRNLSHYREGIFLSTLSDVDVDYVLKAPQSVQLRWIEMNKTTKKLLSDLANAVGDIVDKPVATLSPLEVGRALISAYETSAPWVQRTSRLPEHAKRVRALFKRSNDPQKFAFDDIPALYGKDVDVLTDEGIAEIAQNIREGLLEIREAYPAMLSRMREQILNELQVHGRSQKAYEELNERAENIQDVAGDLRLRAFVNQLATFSDDQQSMEALAGLGINKPAKAWIDSDIDRAIVQLTLLAQQFNQHEAVARVAGRKDKRSAMAMIVSIDGRPTPLIEEFDILDSDFEKVADLSRKIEEVLDQTSDKTSKNIILAALARVGATRIEQSEEEETVDG